MIDETQILSLRGLPEEYVPSRALGRGGFGAVYLARQTTIDRQVAIKVLQGALTAEARHVDRFLQEGTVLARLKHRNIVRVLTSGHLDSGAPYLVMEYLDGEPLTERLARDEPMALREAVDLMAQVAEGLGAAHEAGIIHRDIKPDNIMLVTEGRDLVVKVLDFGIAKLRDSEAVRTAQAESFFTATYMAPEIASTGMAGVTPASDVYSCGVLFYRILTGEPPFKRGSIVEYIRAHALEPPPALPAGLDTLVPGLRELVASCLAKEAADRPASGYAFCDGLRALAAAPPDATVPVSSGPSSGEPDPAIVLLSTGNRDEPVEDEPTLARAAAPPENDASRRWIPVAAAAVAALVVAGAAVALWPSASEDGPPASANVGCAAEARIEAALRDGRWDVATHRAKSCPERVDLTARARKGREVEDALDRLDGREAPTEARVAEAETIATTLQGDHPLSVRAKRVSRRLARRLARMTSVPPPLAKPSPVAKSSPAPEPAPDPEPPPQAAQPPEPEPAPEPEPDPTPPSAAPRPPPAAHPTSPKPTVAPPVLPRRRTDDKKRRRAQGKASYSEGRRLTARGDHRAAARAYARCIRLARHPLCHKALGTTAIRLGDRARARRHLKRYLSLRPTAGDTAAVRRVLSGLK